MIIILGPTATGKTTLATYLALKLNGEIISADSRQVFRGMDIGTGKDLLEYVVDEIPIPYHLIDIVDPGIEYSVFNFQQDCYKAYDSIIERGRTPILCGGTGLYLESIAKAYPLIEVPHNEKLREKLASKTLEELTDYLSTYKKLHNHTDTESYERVLRAIEIEKFYASHKEEVEKSRRIIPYTVFGVDYDREIIRQRITQRLKQRLEEGMIEEVENLLNSGISHARLQRYGLEYKYVSLYLSGKINYQLLFDELNISIHQFAKRQTTWFRRMERNGVTINWIKGELSLVEKSEFILKCYNLKISDI
jgi:tRNA dimethylallyltransferase